MIYQIGKKQCLNSGWKRNDIDPLKVILLSNPPPIWNFLGLWPPHLPGISNSLRGGGLDIFWNLHILFENNIFYSTYSIKTKILSMLGTEYFLKIREILVVTSAYAVRPYGL